MKMRALIVCLFAGLLTAQQRPLEEGYALSGRVVSAVDGTPLSGVLITTRNGDTRKTWTGADGRFQFEGLKARVATLGVNKAGFHRAIGRQLIGEQEPSEMTFRMIPESVIAGTALDEDGNPLEGARVELRELFSRPWLRPRITMRSTTQIVDDRGRFRISGLASGDYLVVLRPTTNPTPAGRNVLAQSSQVYPPLDSGGIPVTLRVRPGDRHENINLRARPAGKTMLLGEVAGEGGCGLCDVAVYQRAGEHFVQLDRLSTGPAGSFSVEGLAPGAYVLALRGQSGAAFGEVRLAEGATTRTRLYVSADSKMRMTVKLFDRPSEETDWVSNFRPPVLVDYLGPQLPDVARPSRPTSPGPGIIEYEISGLMPGPYALRALGVPEGGYAASASVEGRAVTDGLFTVSPEAASLDAEVVIAFDSGTVEGTVETDSDLPLDRVSVYLMPTHPVLPWSVNDRRVNKSGAFSVKAGPGRYDVYALPEGAVWNLADPRDIERLSAYRASIEVRSGRTVKTKVKLAPIWTW